MAQRDATLSRQLGIGRRALKIHLEYRSTQLLRSRVIAGERIVDDLLERANRNRHRRQSLGFPDPVQ
jgi:hypothetical protein